MKTTTHRFTNRARLTASLSLIAGGVLGLLAACSSDGGNPKPSTPPVVNTGGGGHGGTTIGDAGESSVGGSNTVGGSSGNRAGSGNGGSGQVEEGAGAGGEAGEAGAGPISPTCADSDEGFLNQPTKSQKAPFDNSKRLGAAAALPPLP
jgi:hypothetical protein